MTRQEEATLSDETQRKLRGLKEERAAIFDAIKEAELHEEAAREAYDAHVTRLAELET